MVQSTPPRWAPATTRRMNLVSGNRRADITERKVVGASCTTLTMLDSSRGRRSKKKRSRTPPDRLSATNAPGCRKSGKPKTDKSGSATVQTRNGSDRYRTGSAASSVLMTNTPRCTTHTTTTTTHTTTAYLTPGTNPVPVTSWPWTHDCRDGK